MDGFAGKEKGEAGWAQGKETGHEERENWAGFWDWAEMLGFAMGFPFLFPISYFKHYSNLIELKFKFEFNPSTQTNKRDAPA